MSDSNRVKDRLLEFLQYNGLSQSKFEKKCGLANGYVNNIRRVLDFVFEKNNGPRIAAEAV